MKKHLIDFYGFLFRRDFKVSMLELVTYGFLSHMYLSTPQDASWTRIGLTLVGFFVAYIVFTLIYGLLDRHSRKLTNRYLNGITLGSRNIKLNLEAGEDVTQEEIQKITMIINRLNKHLE